MKNVRAISRGVSAAALLAEGRDRLRDEVPSVFGESWPRCRGSGGQFPVELPKSTLPLFGWRRHDCENRVGEEARCWKC